VQFAESLGATVSRLKGNNVADSVADFVRDKHITQVIFGRSAVDGWKKWIYMTAMTKFLQNAPGVDVHIVTQEQD
jgi:two-component system sensor histidine kinase KdpD